MLSAIITIYNNLYSKLRNNFPNLYIICISLIVSIWFQGMFRIVHKMFPNNLRNNMLMMVIPLILLYFGDGRLDEIYTFEGIHKRIGSLQYIDNASN